MVWPEEDWVPISAIQHYSYCPRQWALIHIEQIFEENLFTMKGRWAHERVDEEGVQRTDGVRVYRALPVWSETHGLVGKCDLVEWRDGAPYPVEFKHGRIRRMIHDDLQVCAQGMCLEEMFGVPVPRGAVFHVRSRRRREVEFTSELRERVLMVAGAIRRLKTAERLPPAVRDRRCVHCSLKEACMPDLTDGHLREEVMWPMMAGGEREP
ncbi:MAG: CRISPR-associated protein Cas4 [Alicyclobacillaceae bacterium]|nr:CRISPR-associated protein Cas4 [Alicyclobacillaceae bacterium]